MSSGMDEKALSEIESTILENNAEEANQDNLTGGQKHKINRRVSLKAGNSG